MSPTAIIEFAKRREVRALRKEAARLRAENQRLAAMAYRDPLTGLRNRRSFTERMAEEICRLVRNPHGTLALLVVDVNDFKRLNDTRGHAAGDAALTAVATLLESLVRTEDIVCRIGGDEFAILLPACGLAAGQVVAGRLRQMMARLASTGLGENPLAIGVAAWAQGDDAERLLTRADQDMYADKAGLRSNAA